MRLAAFVLAVGIGSAQPASEVFDHAYTAYGALLSSVVRGARVDYARLRSRRSDLDSVVRQFATVGTVDQWEMHQQMAFWINAYNLLTLKAVADRYPIGSIRDIDGVWTDLRFTVASRQLSLDDIEHRILRPAFRDPRVHFAINCASVSCPPLREEPYVAERLDTQLDDAARRYLASPSGLRVLRSTLYVSSIFKWYGEDFVPAFGSVQGVVAKYGPPDAQRVAASPHAAVRYLRYDWSLNEVAVTPLKRRSSASSSSSDIFPG